MIPSFRALVWSAAMALVSAPVLPQWEYEWGFQSIGGGDNSATACQFAPDGSILLAGGYSGNMPISIGGITWYSPLHPSSPGYAAKLDPSGNALWAHFIQEQGPIPGFNSPFAIAADSAGNVFITGNYTDSLLWDGNMILTDTSNDLNNAARSVYVMKMDPAGDLLWSIGMSTGGLGASVTDLSVTDIGDLILVGPTTVAPLPTCRLMKLSGVDGTVLFDLAADAPGISLENVGLDSVGNILVQGRAAGPFTLGGGPVCPYNNVLGSIERSIFVGKFDPNGAAQWYHVPDQGYGPNWFMGSSTLAVAADGSSRVVSYKLLRFGTDTIATGTLGRSGVYALDADGAVLWSRAINTTGWVLFTHCELDAAGGLLVAGEITDGPVDLTDTVVSPSAGVDALVLRFDTTGAISGLMVGPQLLAGMGSGAVTGLSLDASGQPAICGGFFGTDPVFGLDTLVGFATSFLARLVEVPIATGSIALSAEPPLKVFPNPADRSITLDLGLAREANAVVYDASVAEVWSGMIDSSSLRLDVSSWPDGIYHIRMVEPGERTSARFVVAH